MEQKYDTDGIHVVADFYHVKRKEALNDISILQGLACAAIMMSRAKLIRMETHKFEPQGITLTAIISESSMDIHTYPEHDYISISFYTCGDNADPLIGLKFLKEVLQPEDENVLVLKRGTKKSLDICVVNME